MLRPGLESLLLFSLPDAARIIVEIPMGDGDKNAREALPVTANKRAQPEMAFMLVVSSSWLLFCCSPPPAGRRRRMQIALHLSVEVEGAFTSLLLFGEDLAVSSPLNDVTMPMIVAMAMP
jgi:hypothetical protein